MAKQHSIVLRVFWHPLCALLFAGYNVFSIARYGAGGQRILGLAVTSIWLALALYDFFSNHRLLNWFNEDAREETGSERASAEDRIAQQWYEKKSAMMEESLAREHDRVMHALIPFAIGGALDLYYYPNGIAGTGIATKELCELPNDGPGNAVYRTYELVMFTRHKLALEEANDPTTPFGKAHANMNRVLNYIARYSGMAKLNPNETCEFPAEMEQVGGKCLIFDGYACHSNDMVENFGLLLIIEIFRSEMEFAREHGGGKLIALLKKKGIYPYSDLEREAVV